MHSQGRVLRTHRFITSFTTCGKSSLACTIGLLCCYGTVFAETSTAPSNESAQEPVRKFNDVLNDLLNEFSYDLKTAQGIALKNVSVRRVALSEAIPKSYETLIETLVTERFQKHSKIKALQCPSCRVKRSVVENGRVKISLPINNSAELDAIANQVGIETWLDIALLYQETAMILAFNAFDSKTKELLWSKVYNSENLYRKAEGIPTAESLEKGEKSDKESEVQKSSNLYLTFAGGYSVLPNVKNSTGMLSFPISMSERFNYGRSEIGAAVIPFISPNQLLSNYKNIDGDPVKTGEAQQDPNAGAIKDFTIALGLFAEYQQNFFSGAENFEVIRFGFHTGLGVIAASGYMSLASRFGPVAKLGRHFVVKSGLLYSMPTTISIAKGLTYKTKGGVGGDITFGLSF